MTNRPLQDTVGGLRLFWWVRALRGGFALLFAALLLFIRTLLGTLFFDPVLLVFLTLLLGFYVFGNGILFVIASIFARQHRLPHWGLVLSEGVVAIALGAFIACTLFLDVHSMALLAGLNALAAGIFQLILGIRMRIYRPYLLLLGLAGIVSIAVGVLFLHAPGESIPVVVERLCAFEFFYAAVNVYFAAQLHRNPSPNMTG